MLSVFCLSACNTATKKSTKSQEALNASEQEYKAPERATAYERSAPPKGKQWSGWKYKGKSQDCFYRVGRACFANAKSACNAAGCGQKECKETDSAPIKVSCK